MDADFIEKRVRDLSTKRVDRFSMDPKRFDEILAELRVGLSDIHNCFDDVNIGDILEEVCTDFANQELLSDQPPSFKEPAVVLQHCAVLYSRKVDYLHTHVFDISDSLASVTDDPAGEGEAAGAAAAPGAKRRRRASSALEFAHVALAECGGAWRVPEPPRPPPTLPRLYVELEPRVLSPHDAPLLDYGGEPLGLASDYHVTWCLQDGFLTDDLSEWGGGTDCALRPLSLLELQAAIDAAAPASPPRAWTPPPASPPPASPPPASPPPASPPLAASTPLPAEPAAARRKRRRAARLEDVAEGALRLLLTAELRAWTARRREFAPEPQWRARVVSRRSRRVLEVRAAVAPQREFRGFEDEHPEPGGFPGWAASTARAAEALAARLLAERAALGTSLCAGDVDSDDDGFFERSSFTSCDSSRADCFASPAPAAPAAAPRRASDAAARAAEAEAWSARVAARAAEAEARGGVDVRALGDAVLRALPPREPLPVAALLARTAAAPHAVSHVLLTALFLANSENVKIVRGAPGTVNSFSLRLLSTDQSALHAAAEAAFAPA